MRTAFATQLSATSCGASNDFDFIGSEDRAERCERAFRDLHLDFHAREEEKIPFAEVSPKAEALNEGQPPLELAWGSPTASLLNPV